tara:strand:- start:135 stop:683 length:549 start_codon:yes stop_codon:yes gene_type:complete
MTDPALVVRYIEDRCDSELANWDVLFASSSRSDHVPLNSNLLGIDIQCQRRKPGKKSDANTLYITDNQRVASRGVERTGIELEDIRIVEEQYQSSPDYKEGSSFPDRIYRKVRKRPLIIIHLLSIGLKGEDLSTQTPVVAWSISFPTTQHEEKLVEYVVNTTWLRENYQNDLDEDEMEGDDD